MSQHSCPVTCPPVSRCPALSARDDAELVALVRARGLGWKLAFNVLLGRHRDRLFSHCNYRLGNRQDAQDVVQRVLLRAWRAIDRFEGRSTFRTWLYSIAENECRSFAVQRLRYVQSEHIEALIDLYLSDTTLVAEERYALNQAVAAALQRLSDTAREVLWLRFFQDRSLEDIAASLAINLSAAKMRLYRALDQFEVAYRQVTAAPGAAR